MKLNTMMPFLEALRSPGHFALFEAIRNKRHRQALLLTEAGGVDVNCRNGRGLTPLIYSVTQIEDDKSSAKFVRLLLEAGSDPNVTDWDGLTPLMHASRLGLADAVKVLLENKRTNPNLTDPDGNTALIYAALNGRENVISAFVSHFKQNLSCLNLNQKNNQGSTALHLAITSGNDECARLLTKETQFFPTNITDFPDPKVLDRSPTPVDNKAICPELQCFSPKKRTKPIMQIPKTTKNVGINYNNGKSEVQMDPGVKKTRLFDGHKESNLEAGTENKATQTVQFKPHLRTTKPVCRILEPINSLDSVFIHHLSAQTDRSSRNTSDLSTSRNKSGYKNSWWDGKTSLMFSNLRPDSEPNHLPIIPCSSPLPPVKKTVHSSPGRRDCYTKSKFNKDLRSANKDFLKKNLTIDTF